jgi:hypothetical protein
VEESEASPARGRSVLAAVLIALAIFAAAVFLIFRGGGTSDEDAIRAWFHSPAGGGAPASVLPAIHLGGGSDLGGNSCLLTEAMRGSHQVLRCPITTDAPNPTLHTCFVITDGKVLRGGWQLAKLDACNALRYDRRTGMFVDLAAGARYAITAS